MFAHGNNLPRRQFRETRLSRINLIRRQIPQFKLPNDAFSYLDAGKSPFA
jgi:hypothetical protein